MSQKPSQEWFTLSWVISYPLFAVLAALVFLSAQEIAQPAARSKVARVRTVADSPAWAASFPRRVEVINQAVLDSPLKAVLASEISQGSAALRWPHRVFELTVGREGQHGVEAAVGALRGVDPGLNLVVEEMFNGTQVLVGLDGLLTHTLRIYWADAATRPRVGMVIAALGDDLRLARQVLEFQENVSIAVRPFRPFSAQVAELARMFERDVLLDGSGLATERHGLDAALQTVPGAVGVALVGEAVSPDAVSEVARRGLFSLQPDVRGAKRATVFAIPSGDGWEEAVDTLMRRVREGGVAIAIADVGDGDELDRLGALLGRWRKDEIEVVSVSLIVGELAVAATAPPPT